MTFKNAISNLINLCLKPFRAKLISENHWKKLNIISGSQYGEDKLALRMLSDMGLRQPNYLDIGANDPIVLSNTYALYMMGGWGVCVEPNPVLCNKIAKMRPRDICLNCGVAPYKSEGMEFYELTADTLSSFSKEAAEQVAVLSGEKIKRTYKVPMMTVPDIMNDYMNNRVDFLSLDIEGDSLEILKSINYEKCRPAIMCLEVAEFGVPMWKLRNNGIDEFMINNGYIVFADTWTNKLFFDKNRFK